MKKPFAVIAIFALAVSGLVITRVGNSGAAPPVPLFTQCPVIDTDTGCAVLLVLNANGTVSVQTDPNQPQLRSTSGARHAVLIGVQNNRNDVVNSVGVSSNVPAFNFDGHGLCASIPPVPVGCPFGPTGYEGPNTSFSNPNVALTAGTVNFTGGIQPAGSRYFSLEGSTTDFSGYSTGTDIFADALRTNSVTLLNVNAGFAGAAANSRPLTHIDNEMGLPVVQNNLATLPHDPTSNFNSYGRGAGLELGLGTTLPSPNDPNQLILANLAEQAAPPPTPNGTEPDGSVVQQIGPVHIEPLLYASLLAGQAKADYGSCTTDPQNLAFGRASVAQLELINQSTVPNIPLGDPNSVALLTTTGGQPTNRTVSSSRSFTRLVPNGDGTFGLVSETHQTVAPITLFKGSASPVTIEVLGEAVLTATATGKTGGATVTYTPPPLIRIITTGGITNIPSSTPSPINLTITPLITLSIYEHPRAPAQAVPNNDETASPADPIQSLDGTNAWGAWDLVRLKLLPGAFPSPPSDLVQLRLLHMESRATVASGGVVCPTFAVNAISVSPTTTTTTAATTTTTAPATTTTTAAPTTTTTAPATTTTTAAPTTTTTAPTTTTTAAPTTTTTAAPTTTTTAPAAAPQQGTTTTTAAPTTTTTAPAATQQQATTTTTAAPATTTTTMPPTPAANPATTTTTVVQPQVQAQTFTQAPPAVAVTATPSFTG